MPREIISKLREAKKYFEEMGRATPTGTVCVRVFSPLPATTEVANDSAKNVYLGSVNSESRHFLP